VLWRGLLTDWQLPPLPENWKDRPLREQVLWRRGLHEEDAQRRYFQGQLSDLASPTDLPDMEKAVALLAKAIREKALVFIAGDYDVDGISSAALLGRFLERWGVPYHIRLPTREEGYGLSPKIIQEAISQRPRLFISVDCGTKNPGEIAQLKAAGIPTIICDHHAVPENPETWPPADAFINPHRPDASGAYRELSAAGLVFQLLHAYLLSEKGGTLTLLEETIDIVGVATLADVMPLSGENRLLSRLALQKLQDEPILGYQTLLQTLSLTKCRVESRDVVFRIVPRLNAVGRLYKPEPALRLLLTADPAEAQAIVKQLEQYNRERQDLQDKAMGEAIHMFRERYGANPSLWPKALVVANPTWHKGVIGLVAANLTELYERPSAVLTQSAQPGIWVGSARSVEGVPLHELIEGWCRPYLLKGGGHAMAAGFSVQDKYLREFGKAFIAGASHYLAQREHKVSLLDGDILAGQVMKEELDRLTSDFEPVGPANPAPRYLLRSVRVISQDGRTLMIYAADGQSNGAFEGRITFSSYRWSEDWPKLMRQQEGLVVTPFRSQAGRPIQLKVRDVIIGSQSANQ
jgi:single-stranded-DNA-specific exonuclease